MNVSKTELHVMHGMGHAEITSRYGGCISTRDDSGQPHKVYKYLGVYFYTSEHSENMFDFVNAEITSFFAHLAPLELTASELIMLTNKQLIPTIAYRLLASPLSDEQLARVQKKMWFNIAKYGRLPVNFPPKKPL